MPAEVAAASSRFRDSLCFFYETHRQPSSHSYGIVGTSCTQTRQDAAMAATTFNTAHQAAQSDSAGIRPANEAATVAAPFQPLDPNIVNETIPAFYIGRNRVGFWVARDVKGRIGGLFLLKNSALSFARRHSWPAGCATIFPSARFELDLENEGNPLLVNLGSLIRLAAHSRQRTVTFIREITEGLKRRLKDFHVR
jgi:hypothetical protein